MSAISYGTVSAITYLLTYLLYLITVKGSAKTGTKKRVTEKRGCKKSRDLKSLFRVHTVTGFGAGTSKARSGVRERKRERRQQAARLDRPQRERPRRTHDLRDHRQHALRPTQAGG